jgi:hypothetical protein
MLVCMCAAPVFECLLVEDFPGHRFLIHYERGLHLSGGVVQSLIVHCYLAGIPLYEVSNLFIRIDNSTSAVIFSDSRKSNDYLFIVRIAGHSNDSDHW